MKVLHVNEHVTRKGGVETYLLALLPLLEERNIRPVVAYGQGEPEGDVEAVRLPAVSVAGFGAERAGREETAALLREVEPDLVHVHNWQNAGVLETCMEHAPVVMTTHDYRAICPANMFFYKRTQEVCGRDHGVLGCFATTLRKHCVTPRPQYAGYFYHRTRKVRQRRHGLTHVIAPSGGARDRFVRAGFDADGISVVPYFCPLEPAEAPRPVPKRRTITFMGRAARNKGHEYFVQALGLLPEDVRGIMVGSFGESGADDLRRRAEEAGCAGRLEIRQWATREEVLQIMDATTVFVFPSLWEETLGIVGVEALSRGVPVVASALGGVPEWLDDGINGHLVAPKAPEQIRDAVLDLSSSPERLAAAGRAAIEKVRARFLPEQHVESLIQIYDRAAR